MYRWLLVFHFISIVAWFVGLFYIFRLFIYHQKYREKTDLAKIYTVMEWKLLYMLMHPAIFMTYATGMAMSMVRPDLLNEAWMGLKLLGVALLTVYHVYCAHVYKRFARGEFILSEAACRTINQAPIVLLIVIMILTVIRPSL